MDGLSLLNDFKLLKKNVLYSIMEDVQNYELLEHERNIKQTNKKKTNTNSNVEKKEEKTSLLSRLKIKISSTRNNSKILSGIDRKDNLNTPISLSTHTPLTPVKDITIKSTIPISPPNKQNSSPISLSPVKQQK